MNRLIRILQALVLVAVAASFCHADSSYVGFKKKAGGAAGGGCMSGTYVMAWDGDYTGDTDKMCIGSTPTDGTITGATVGTDYGESSNGVLVGVSDERISYVLADGDFVEGNAYTLCLRMRIGSDGTDIGTTIFEISEDTNNTNYLSVLVTDDERLRCVSAGDNTLDTVQSSVASLTRDGSTWITGVCSWKPETAAGNDMGVSVNGGGAWTEEDDDPVTQVIQINALSAGNFNQFQAAGGDPTHIDKWALVSGYKAACPW